MDIRVTGGLWPGVYSHRYDIDEWRVRRGGSFDRPAVTGEEINSSLDGPDKNRLNHLSNDDMSLDTFPTDIAIASLTAAALNVKNYYVNLLLRDGEYVRDLDLGQNIVE